MQPCECLSLIITPCLWLYMAKKGSKDALYGALSVPKLILNVGPMVCTWTMHHEAKLNFHLIIYFSGLLSSLCLSTFPTVKIK